MVFFLPSNLVSLNHILSSQTVVVIFQHEFPMLCWKETYCLLTRLKLGQMRGLSSSKGVVFYLDACKGVHWSSILTTGPQIYKNIEAVMATKGRPGNHKEGKKKMQVSKLQRTFWFSLFHSDSTKMLLFLSMQNKEKERHIKTNAVKEGRYLIGLKGSKGVRE